MKVRRKIMALGTALAMAFVMIASLVMVTDVKAAMNLPEIVDQEGYGIQYCLNDDGTIEQQNYQKNYLARFDKNLSLDAVTVDKASKVVTITNMKCSGMDIDTNKGWTYIFKGTNSLSNRLCVESESFAGPDAVGEVTIGLTNDSKLTIGDGSGENEGLSYIKITLADGTTCSVDLDKAETQYGRKNVKDAVFSGATSGGGTDDPTVDPKAPTEDTSTVTTVTDGSSATIAPAEDGTLSFRIDKPLSYFEDGGELYIDGTLIERSQYTYKEGSTIITLVKELATKLSDGAAHVFKVKFNDGTEVTSNITIGTAAAASSTAATTGTAASSTAATTTKVTSPKTADVLPIAGIALVFVGATAIGVIAIRRKNS